MMRLASLAAAAALALSFAGEAQALPIAAAPSNTATPSSIILARGGCGFGEHRGPMMGCRLNHGPRGRMRRMMTGAPLGCPPGKHRGPRGFCHF